MAATPTASVIQAPLNLTPLERPAFAALFAAADSSNSGIITGSVAVAFFARSRPALSASVLGAIWSLADRANNGFLGKAEWAVAMRLMAHAQRGANAEALEALLSQPGPPPSFEGVQLPGQAPTTPSRHLTGNAQQQLLTITPADRARYTRIFASSGPINGLLDGEKAKSIFVRSQLPFETLGAIWTLADTRLRGALDLTDFIIGMHFLQATMNGTLPSLPATLPVGLYEQASGGAPPPTSPLTAQNTGGSAGGLQRQLTGNALQRQMTGGAMSPTPMSPQQSSIMRGGPAASSFLSPQRTGGVAVATEWLVTPSDKVKADRFFDGLDTERKGTLEGQAAVPFFMQSGLPEATLAHVWDLSDITQSGTLSRDEFAVAMHLINGALAGQPLPQELPPALVPPTLRGQDLPQAVNPQESDTQKDLFSLMDDDPAPLPINTQSAFVTPAAPPVSAAPKSSGPFDDDFFGTPAPPSAVAPAVAAVRTATPTALSPVPTGSSSMRAVPTATSVGLPADASAEFGNKKLALDSTTKSVSDLQSKRSALEGSVASSASSISELESRLASLRVTHDAEASAVRALEERARAQAVELAQLRKDVITAESELSALRAEKDEVEQTVMRDREDVRDMKRRMAEVQSETLGLRNTLEKLRKEMRQQRGLVAISKKQLATAEAEQTKVHQETERVRAGEDEETTSVGAGVTSEAALPIPTVAQTASPAANEAALSPTASIRSNNPFDCFTSPPPAAAGSASPVSNNNAALAAGGVGAALGLGAASALHAPRSNDADASVMAESASATQEASTTVIGAPDGTDPFALPDAPSTTAPTATTVHAKEPSAASFDDDFGSAFVSAPSVATAGAAVAPTGASTSGHAPRAASAFDDAFADLDEPKAVLSTSAVEDAAVGRQPSSVAATEEAVAESTPKALEASLPTETSGVSAFSAAPVESASFDDFEDSFAPAGESVSAPLPSSITAAAAAAPVVNPSPAEDGSSSFETALPSSANSAPLEREAEEVDDSSDEDEGPEDLEGSTAKSQSGEVGSPAVSSVGAGTSSALAPAQTTALAAGRFPELDQVDAMTSASAASAAPASAPITVQHTGDTANDAFEDAVTGETPSSSAALSAPSPWGDSAAPTGGVAGSSAFQPVGSAFSTRSSEYGHEKFSTAAEGAASSFAQPSTTGNFPLGATAAAPGGPADRSISPNKTRRAPPPAPVRGGTAGSPFDGGAAAISSSSFGSAPAPSAAGKGPVAASFDDFDSAFQDLGPVSSTGGQPSATAASAAPLPGFDDAFGDVDDFAFVPSFNAPNSSSGARGAREGLPATTDAFSTAFPPTTANAATAPAHQSGGFGFDDFEASFADASLSPATSAAGPGAGAVASGSGTNSEFSFADDFAAPSASAATAAGGASLAPPPSTAPVKAPSPALPDDAPPVKQLAAMGFSREQVIKALEQSNYKVDRALERLLAAAT